MSVAKVTEIIVSSDKGFDDALQEGISRAQRTLDNVTGVWIKDQYVQVRDGKAVEYRLNLKVTFVLRA